MINEKTNFKARFFLTLTVFVLLTSIESLAQDTLWANHFGGPGSQAGKVIRQTLDGNYILAGSPYILAKVTPYGDSLWMRYYAGVGGALDVRQAPDGGFVVFGGSQFDSFPADALIIRTDSLGDTVWTRKYGGSGWDFASAGLLTADGGAIVAGYTASFGAGWRDLWLLRLDSGGDTAWTKIYGGQWDDEIYSMDSTGDGGYVMAGRTHSWGSGNDDLWVVRVDSLCDTLWTRTFGSYGDDGAQSIRRASDGGFFAFGYTMLNDNYDLFLVKLDGFGNLEWTRTYGGAGDDIGISFIEDAGSLFLVGVTYSTGNFGGDAFVMKTSLSGDSLFLKAYDGGGYDEGLDIAPAFGGGYIISGQTRLGPGDSDVWVLKFVDSDLWHVSPLGDDWHGAGTEDEPFRTIQRAIAISGDGDTLLVGPGMYQENITFSGKSVVLGSHYLVTSDTNYISSTMIDGGHAGPAVTFSGGEDSTSLLVGFTIRNGLSDFGGGICCGPNSSPRIAFNRIEDNMARRTGGGIYSLDASPSIISNLIESNTAYDSSGSGYGGGIFCDGSGILIEGNEIQENVALGLVGGDGGGICGRRSSLSIASNAIEGNSSGRGGGLLLDSCSYALSRNEVEGNSATSYGGGLAILNSAGQSALENRISGNLAYDRGGGLILWDSSPLVRGNLFLGNTARHPVNEYRDGGAVCLIHSDATVDRNTIVGNSAFYCGGIISDHNSNPIITNDILRGNTRPQLGYDSGNPTIRFCDVEGGYYGAGMIDCDPWFCGPNHGDFALTEESCCRGAGCDAYGNPDSRVDIGAFGAECFANYIPGDVNASGSSDGIDVSFSVNYFKGYGPPPPVVCPDCPSVGQELYGAGDVNGNCQFNGVDITYYVNYLKGFGPALTYCPSCPPAG
jgi:hypothetical protein